ncbi:MAG: CCA tRNA nucleotidyltransferase [Crenarchaeota archaeon]|nr:CCA tRNA nucleotidyltransferase [Thermoproteota archaeon]
MDPYSRVLQEVLSKVKPKSSEYYYLSFIARIACSYTSECLDELGVRDYEVTVQGSYAKDTFISGDADIDVFFLLKPYRYTTRFIEMFLVPGLKRCLESRGIRTVLDYAAHPYVTAFVGGVEVNIVPAFRVSSPRNLVSPVDRTPFHTEYVRSKLSEGMRDEVRLLKAFMKSVGVYGAEVRVQGFSGYLTELLVIKYGSFLNVLRESAKWKPYKTCIDIEGYYKSPRDCLKRFPRSVMVVVDPVDPQRNAAAAVGLRSFSLFRICARMFLLKPSTKFFEPYRPKAEVQDVERSVLAACSSMNRKLVLVLSNTAHRSEDVVWGQLRRLERSLVNQLKSRELRVLYIDSYLEHSKGIAMTLVDLQACAAPCHVHEGPPAHIVENAVRFIAKNRDSLVGPWIDVDNRLLCIRIRDIASEVMECVKKVELEFVKPEKVIDLCSSLSELRNLALNSDTVSWLYESINRERFRRLLS